VDAAWPRVPSIRKSERREWGSVVQGRSEKPVGVGLIGAGAIMRLSHAPFVVPDYD